MTAASLWALAERGLASATALVLLGGDRTHPTIETDGGAAVFRIRRRRGHGTLSRAERNRFRAFARTVTALGYRTYTVRFARRKTTWTVAPWADVPVDLACVYVPAERIRVP